MDFLDSLSIFVQGGHGGSGAKTFRKEKYVPKGGPDGGDGGDGGNVIIRSDERINNFLDIKNKKKYVAKAGGNGQGARKSGSKGQDVTIKVPCGTLIYNEEHELIADLTQDRDSVVIAKGGMGGKGNANFATSRVQAPTHAQPGMPPESATIFLELKTIADVGLIGPPNAGKSTLLNTLTQTKAVIGDYPFTTKSPNLGIIKYVDKHITVADIPGLIEGAALGKGLGNTFLKHVSRTQFHLIMVGVEASFELTQRKYQSIIDELNQSNESLENIPRYIVLTKADLVLEKTVLSYIQKFESSGLNAIACSSVSQVGIDALKDLIYQHFNA